MNNSISVSFSHFQHAAEEWLSRREVYIYTAELLALYAHGIPVQQAASVVASISNERREKANREEP